MGSSLGKRMSSQKKVIIVGAGAAGFAAASKLISHGFQNVLILEAEQRIGGRINTIPFGTGVLDIGAQWCHGEEDNIVYDLAKDKNLLSSCPLRWDKYRFVSSDGRPLPEKISEKLSDLCMNISESDKVDEMKSYNGSLGNFIAKEFFTAFETDEFKDIDVQLRRELFEWLHQMTNMYVACEDSWYSASCQNYNEYSQCPGDLHLNWKDRGFRTVLDLLQNKISTESGRVIDVESRVVLNKKVTKIIYNACSSTADRIKIECFDGSKYFADHLICTVSLGVLKRRHLTLFQPILPMWKINSIDGLGFGTVDKIFVEFVKPFWTENWLGVSFLWQPNELKEIREDPVNGEWLEHVMGLYPVSFQPNLLLGWIAGAAAPKMEQVSDAHFTAGIQRIINMFLKNQLSMGFKVRNIFRSKWNSNPNFCGSYTYYSMKGDAIGATPRVLAEPVYDSNLKPIIQFAGEATSTHHHSTVHGAIETGHLEAQRLIDLYKQPTYKTENILSKL